MTIKENDKVIKQVRCPACSSEVKQKIANAILLPDADYKEGLECDQDAFASIQFKCPKCKTLVYLNIYKKENIDEQERSF